MQPRKPETDFLSQQVLGHLLGVLDDDEQRRFEARLEQEPQYAQEFARWRRLLASLEAVRPEYSPPPGLTARTCRFVAAQKASPRARRCGMSPVPSSPSWIGGAGWLDVSAVVLLLVSAVLVLLPALCTSRLHARLAVCQNGLRHYGLSLTEYSQRHGDSLAQLAQDRRVKQVDAVASDPARIGMTIPSVRAIWPEPSSSAQPRLPGNPVQIGVWRPVASVSPSPQAEWRAARRVVQMSSPLSLDALGKANTRTRNSARICSCSPSARLALPADLSETTLADAADDHGDLGWNLLFEDNHVALFSYWSQQEVADAFFSDGDSLPAARLFASSTFRDR